MLDAGINEEATIDAKTQTMRLVIVTSEVGDDGSFVEGHIERDGLPKVAFSGWMGLLEAVESLLHLNPGVSRTP